MLDGNIRKTSKTEVNPLLEANLVLKCAHAKKNHTRKVLA